MTSVTVRRTGSTHRRSRWGWRTVLEQDRRPERYLVTLPGGRAGGIPGVARIAWPHVDSRVGPRRRPLGGKTGEPGPRRDISPGPSCQRTLVAPAPPAFLTPIAPAPDTGTFQDMSQHNEDADWVALEDLQLTLHLRPRVSAQVRHLVEVLDDCPPILVERQGCVLIDGHMRLAAARVLGRTRLPVMWTTGSPAGLLEQAVIANTRHGVPLTTAQRKAAAVRLLALAPGWSNGRIAQACGVSEPMVRRLPRPGPSPTDVDVRLGADGKAYPQGGHARMPLECCWPSTPARRPGRSPGPPGCRQ